VFKTVTEQLQQNKNFATCSVVTARFKIESEIWGSLPPKIGCPKTSKWQQCIASE